MTAWTVDAQLTNSKRPGVYGCDNGLIRCTPIVTSNADWRWVVGTWAGLKSRYTFVDVPGAGTVMVWSWTRGNQQGLDANESIVKTIHFG